MDNETLTILISGASGLFVLDRTIALVKAMRNNQPSADTTNPSLESIKATLKRIESVQETHTDIIHRLASGQEVLLDRSCKSPKADN